MMMSNSIRSALLAFLLAPFLAGPAMAARLALVIGNDDYAHVERLEKAVNDARAMGRSLEALGFAATVVTDAGRREMNRAIQDFARSVGDGDTALFFYAGHGVEIDGENFLLPTDTPDARDGDADFVRGEAIALNDVLERLRARRARINIVMLDACRDNPFSRAGTRSLGSQAGLARISAPQGTFVMYSADVGEAALDRLGEDDSNPNSVFTRTLIPLMSDPALDLVDTAREVRRRVRDLAATVRHRQTPAYYDAVLGDFRFAGAAGPQPDAQAGPPARGGESDSKDGPDSSRGGDAAPVAGAMPAGPMIVSGGEKDSVRVWNAETGALIGELEGEKIVLSAVALTEGGASLAVAGADGALFSYSLPDFKKKKALFAGFRISHIAEAPDGALILGGRDGTVARLEPGDWTLSWRAAIHGGIVSPILPRPGARALTASADGGIALIDLRDGSVLSRAATGRAVTDIAPLPSGEIMAAHEDGTVDAVDLAAGKVRASFRGNKGWISAIANAPGASGFVTAGVDGEIAFWAPGSGSPILVRSAHDDVASAARFLRIGADQALVTAGFDGIVRVWKPGGAPLRQMDHGSAILHLAIAGN